MNKYLFLFLFTAQLLGSCDYRTASKNRFERVTNIALPDSLYIIEDIFESAGPDYGLYYKVHLLENDCDDFLIKIKKSSKWTQSEHTWEINKTHDGTIYHIIFSVKECTLSYTEELI